MGAWLTLCSRDEEVGLAAICGGDDRGSMWEVRDGYELRRYLVK